MIRMEFLLLLLTIGELPWMCLRHNEQMTAELRLSGLHSAMEISLCFYAAFEEHFWISNKKVQFELASLLATQFNIKTRHTSVAVFPTNSPFFLSSCYNAIDAIPDEERQRKRKSVRTLKTCEKV
ncbi:CLUMA_CG010990, isoform A [Clunio marinus]|uniref:CLUMA_CG010990, isoform A n=1 Tax=Clunio marinus TaxID=568069 RepID=A0A1J1IDG9_9DIPT|nr:CLUMA_CG010990, isoform A [Clunio marinus]